jgi:hypothetical protein
VDGVHGEDLPSCNRNILIFLLFHLSFSGKTGTEDVNKGCGEEEGCGKEEEGLACCRFLIVITNAMAVEKELFK